MSSTMRAWRLTAGQLIEETIPRPVPEPGEILVRVQAAGVTPTEIGWFPTTHRKDGSARGPAVPGHEFAGVVAAFGDGVADVKIDQEIYGMSDWFADGATAEYCISRPEYIAARPARLSAAQAASVPIGALTAWQGLFERAKLQPGERVLIHGGSGAVGVYAVQMARRHRAVISTTASGRNTEFLVKLGADHVIDYHTQRFEKMIDRVDVVFDTVGGETLRKSWDLLAPTGRMITVAAEDESTRDERTRQAFFIVEPKSEQLSAVAALLDAEELRPVVDAVVPFDQAKVAYAGNAKGRAGHGKVVIQIADNHTIGVSSNDLREHS